MPTLRARFKKQIIAEFMVPAKPSTKVIILCDGMPGVPSKKSLMEFFCKKGYWVFHPRYRGSWESSGEFLARSPHEDILDIIDELPKGFTSLWEKKRFQLEPSKIFLFGGSFGGPAALLCSRDPRVTKVIARSPVVDWNAPSKAEPLDWLYTAVKDSFGEAYRLTRHNWDKLKTGKFYSPVSHIKEFDPKKIFILHAKDDEVVSFRSVNNFVQKVQCSTLFLKRGGHLSANILMEPKVYKKIKEFLYAKG